MQNEYTSNPFHEIITQLHLEAGRIMEDTTDSIASTLPADDEARSARLCEAREAGDDIQALLAAAQVLHRRCRGGLDQD